MSDAAPPPPRRRRWRRRLGGFLLCVLLAVALAPLALGIAPVRRWVAQRMSTELGRTVTIAGLSASWWGGLDLRGLEIQNPPGWTGDPLLVVDRIHVDLRWAALLRGSADALVEIDRPALTLIRAADGQSNLDGLGEGADGAKRRRRSPRPGTGVDLPMFELRLRDGSVVTRDAHARGTGEPPPAERVDGITMNARSSGEGPLHLVLDAVLRGAGVSGGDAPLHAEARLDPQGAGPTRATLPPIDLARLGRTLGTAFDLEGLRGQAQANVDLLLDGRGGATGQASLTLTDLSARRGDGTLSIRSLDASARPEALEGGVRIALALEARDVAAVGFSTREERWVEPRLRLSGTLTRETNGDLRFGDATQPLRLEGRALQGEISGALTGLSGERARADLTARLVLDLSPTVGRLLGLLGSKEDDLRGVLTCDASAQGEAGRIALRAHLEAQGILVGGAGGAEPYREPSGRATVEGTWEGATDTLTLTRGELAAGAMKGALVPPLVARLEPSLEVTGGGTFDADLTRLSSLRALVPALSSLASGTLHVEGKGRVGATTQAEWSLRASNLGFSPGALSSRGYLERDVIVVGRLDGTDGGANGAAHTLTISRLSSALVSLVDGSEPVRVRRDAQGLSLEGRAALNVNLQALGIALDRALGLAPGQSISGWLQASGSGGSTAGGERFELVLAGRDLVLPGERTRGLFDAKVVGARDAAGTTTIEHLAAKGYGLDLEGRAVLAQGADGLEVASANLGADADLAAARPWLALALGLPPEATLAGRLRTDLTVTAQGTGRVLEGKTTIQRLAYRGAKDPKTGHATAFDEPVVTLEQRAVLGAKPGLLEVERCALASDVLSVSLSGTVREAGGEHDLRMNGRLQGDGALLARRLARLLGPGYEDTTGEGRVEGTFLVAGSTAEQGKDLRIEGDLTFRKFSSAGLSLDTGRVVASRPDPAQPLRVAVTSGVNGGTLEATGHATPGREAISWDAKVKIRGLDTSPLLLHEGTGRYLALVLPAIVPADATTQVLSGRMDADLDLASRSLDEPMSLDTLTGKGRVHMTQGAVKQSSLFAGLGGGAGKGLGQLVSLVPGVGKTLAEFQQALAFQELSSTFTLGRRQVNLDPVVLVSPTVDVRFTGVVGFDGRMDLRIPVRLGGDGGQAIERFLPDRTIPVRVRGTSGRPLVVTPDVKLENLGKGLLEDLLKRR